MNEQSLNFLKQLLSTPAPSGDEAAAAQLWRAEARTFADEIETDVQGNSYAHLKGDGPRILLDGHIDEIGFMISHVDEDGYLYFQAIGGWDAQVLVGQRVRLLGNNGHVIGVIGKKPIHLIGSDERDAASKIKNLWIDIGAKNREEVLALVRVGAVGVIDASPYEFMNRRLVSRSLDNRVGAFIVLEALRLLAENRPKATVIATATTQEEITSVGATVAAYRHNPHVAIVVDLTYATDHPDSDKKQDGDVKLGGGVVLSRGSANSSLVYKRLVEVAEQQKIPYTVQITPRDTGTNADDIFRVRAGIATGTIYIPNRYMHTPNEMVDLADVEYAAQLIAAFVRSIGSEREFIPAL